MGVTPEKLTSSLQKRHHLYSELMLEFEKYPNSLKVMTIRLCLFCTFDIFEKVTNVSDRWEAFELIQTLA
ncbi:MAG: hypothetical protein ACSI46_01705 [Gloeotrichia echinulata DVL01]|jgi:hypothetical protein